MVHSYGCIDLIVKSEALEKQHPGYAKYVGKKENVGVGNYDSSLICFPLGMSPYDADISAKRLASLYNFSLPAGDSANNSDSVFIAEPFGPTTECDWIECLGNGSYQIKSSIDEWDSEEWQKEFLQACKRENTRPARAAVFKHTQSVCEKGVYTSNGKTIVLDKPDKSIVYQSEIELPDNLELNSEKASIEVLNEDCLAVARNLENENPLVLNMANRRIPGGGVIGGAGAQEECLFRSSNYYQSLYKVSDKYPLNRDFGGVYTSNVTVFRDLEERGYGLLEKPFKTNFVAVSAINTPDLTDDYRLTDAMKQGTINKIKTILNIAVINGHTTLILSAFGCGVFRNPPNDIALLFKKCLMEPTYSHFFKKIVFAIKKDRNDLLNNNFEAFEECFK